ncbi:hypothetical protein TYRP_011126 [Tyrophagus putrescentiae]|nr:hypothetical protein TYRP_011126 [Tyrophagus putrescentiae]
MPSRDAPTESILRTLATLEPTIDALLKCITPKSPIVREKIEQMEKMISSIPLELAATASNWHAKLANWWVEFATQQAASVGIKAPHHSAANTSDSSSSSSSSSSSVLAAPVVMKSVPSLAPPPPKKWSSARQEPPKEVVAVAAAPASVAVPPPHPPPAAAAAPLVNGNGIKLQAAVLPSPSPTFEERQAAASAAAAARPAQPVQPVQPAQPPAPAPAPAPAATVVANGPNHHPMAVNGDLYEPQPSGTANTSSTATAVTADQPEQIIEPAGDDFDWASSPVNPMRPNPFAQRRQPPPPACHGNMQMNRFRRPARPAYNWD